VTAAIFGLVGVVVGGVLSGVVNWLLERKRVTSAARAIARLTCDDFLHYQSTLVRALAANGWWDSAFLLEPQVDIEDRKLLLGYLDDALSQQVAAAQGWMSYLISRRKSDAAAQGPTSEDLQVMRDTFCRLERAREHLSSKELSGWEFMSFKDGAVLASLPAGTSHPPTLQQLGISSNQCGQRAAVHYGRESSALSRDL
jgi:hypothetical protein